MLDLKELQKEVYQNKVADVAIYLMGISEILGINLEEEIQNKIKKNAQRVYKKVNGVLLKQEG